MYIYPLDHKAVKMGIIHCDKLAIMLLHFPSNSASIERIFSNLGTIQTKLLNIIFIRLALEKVDKLVSCFYLSSAVLQS